MSQSPPKVPSDPVHRKGAETSLSPESELVSPRQSFQIAFINIYIFKPTKLTLAAVEKYKNTASTLNKLAKSRSALMSTFQGLKREAKLPAVKMPLLFQLCQSSSSEDGQDGAGGDKGSTGSNCLPALCILFCASFFVYKWTNKKRS